MFIQRNTNTNMARFILDVANLDAKGIAEVLDVIERDPFLAKGVTSIRCIDETNDNQFYCWDTGTTPMMNALSEKQIEEDKKVLSKY
jgi:hypothetical protein